MGTGIPGSNPESSWQSQLLKVRCDWFCSDQFKSVRGISRSYVMKDCVIVIPLYKVDHTPLERQSILNNISRLAHYNIYFICPESLPVNIVLEICGHAKILRFNDQCFASLEGYNKLLRSSLFYSSFVDYEYLLIMQSDTFVFHDNLDAFCKKGYDYWGAPWIDYELINYKFLRPVLPVFHKSRYLKPLRKVVGKKYLVGNGGLSLRKVDTHLLVTIKHKAAIQQFERDYDKWIAGGAASMMEDIFWTLYVPQFYPEYKIAPWQEAIGFSFEMNPRKAYQLNDHKLPFGCHAFAKVDPEFYKKFIEILN